MIDTADTLVDRDGKKLISLTLKSISQQKHCLEQLNPKDSVEILENNREYRKLLLAEMFKLTRGRHRKNLSVMQKPDAELARNIEVQSRFVQIKLKCRMYPDKDSLNVDYYPILMSAAVMAERKVFQNNQILVDSLSLKNRELHFKNFLKSKERRKQALIDSAEAATRKIRTPVVKSYIHNIKSHCQ